MAPSALKRNRETGLTDATMSSSFSSASRYQLEQFDDSPILVYKYRGGLHTTTQRDLCAWLDKDETLRVTKKKLPRNASYIEVRRHDLFVEEEKIAYADKFNYDTNLAGIKIPNGVWWSRLFFGGYDHLYIVSPEVSSNSSTVDENESHKVTPASTFEQD